MFLWTSGFQNPLVHTYFDMFLWTSKRVLTKSLLLVLVGCFTVVVFFNATNQNVGHGHSSFSVTALFTKPPASRLPAVPNISFFFLPTANEAV